MRYSRFVVTAVVAALVTVGVATPSQAGLTTFCDGTASDVIVPGDLVVAAGRSCQLTGVTIKGNATVRAEANLLLADATVEGHLLVLGNGFAEAIDSQVVGTTRLSGAFGVYSERSDHAGVVNATNPGFLYSVGSTYGNHVRSNGGETFLQSARLARNLTTTGDVFTDVDDTVIEGMIHVSGAEQGSTICASEVDRAAIFTGGELVQIGTGPIAGCSYNVFGDSLRLTDNTAGVVVIGNVIRGDLVCAGSTGTVSVTGNRLRGADHCREANTGALGDLNRGSHADVGERTAGTLDKIEKRTSAGELAADAAGHAFD